MADGKQLLTLQSQIIWRRVFGQKWIFNAASLVSDKRSAKKVLRELSADGLVAVFNDNKYEPTDKVWDSIESIPMDFIELWNRRREDNRCQTNLPYVKIPQIRTATLRLDADKKAMGNLKWLYENQEGNSFYAIKVHWNDELREEDLVEFSGLGDPAHQAEKKIRGSSFGTEVSYLLTNDSLAKHANETIQKERFDSAYGKNLPWALSHLGILEETEAELIKHPGLSTLGGFDARPARNFSTDPEKWGTELASNIEKCLEEIAFHEKLMKALKKVQRTINSEGGFPQFLDEYRNALDEALKRQEETAEV